MLKSLILILSLGCLSFHVVSEEKIGGEPEQETSPQTSHSSTNGPRCVEVAQPPKGGQIGSGSMSGIDDEEVITRLVYAETLAANCPEYNDKMFPGIAMVIFNRVRDLKSVRRAVFGKSMFASSLGGYPAAKWKEFTCPTKGKFDSSLYTRIHNLVRKLKTSPSTNIYQTATHYYLHQHFGGYKNHSWGPGAKLQASLGEKAGQMCLGVYKETKSYMNAPFVE